MLKMNGVDLELLSDDGMYHMVVGAKRGAMCQVSSRYGKANNKHMQ